MPWPLPTLQLVVGEAPAVAGEHLGQRHHVVVGVGFYRLAVRVQLGRAVEVQFVKADREELHHFAGEVLVRQLARRRVFLLVAQVR
jgi:hypothetical protein